MYMIPQNFKNVLAPAISENNHLFIVDPETKEILLLYQKT